MKLLRVQTQVKHEAKLFIEIHKKVTETVLAGIEEAAGQRSISNFWAVISLVWLGLWLLINPGQNIFPICSGGRSPQGPPSERFTEK